MTRMNTLDYARRYRERGWYPVPVPLGQKGPTIKGWQNLRLTEPALAQHFSNGSNIGLLVGQPSGNLVDVDLDCPKARALASEFLPVTELISGRKSSPESHRWYGCEIETEKFIDPVCSDRRQAMIVEIRSSGGQSVVAPSIHPSGETYEWSAKGQPAQLAADTLRRSVRELAACSLLSRYWADGKRHELALAVAGALLRHGWKQEQVEHFIVCAARGAGDSEIEDRRATVSTTIERLAEDKKCSGLPTLKQLLPPGVFEKIIEWLGVTESNNQQDEETNVVNVVPWPELNSQSLFGLAGDFVRAIEAHTESDPAGLLLQFHCAFGNAVGRGPFFTVESDEHHTTLFVVLVGETGTGRKGTSWGHVRKLFEAVDGDWVRDCLTGGLSSGEGLLYHVRDPITKIKRDKKTGIEKDEVVDDGVTDKRLLAFEGELASVFKAQGREGNTLSSMIRNLWDRGTCRSLVKNSPIRTTDAHVSIIGHITRHELQIVLNEVESFNGFCNRFLWACVRRTKFLPRGGRLSSKDSLSLTKRLHTAVSFAQSAGEMALDDAAWQLWDRTYTRLETGRSGLLAKVTQRASPYTLRLACLYALLDCSAVVRQPHLEAALALWQYAEDSARYIFGQHTGDALADDILIALREVDDDGLSRTQIRDLLGRNVSSERIGVALAYLAENGLAFSRTEKGLWPPG